MAFEKTAQLPVEQDSEVTLNDLQETIEYLRNACGGEKGADDMLAKIANCMKTAHEQMANAHSPGTRDKAMHQYNRCIEKAIDDHIPNTALRDRVTIIGGVTTTFALLGSALPGPGTAAGALVGAIVGAIAGAVVGTTISHKIPVEKGHGVRVREMLHEGKLDAIIGSKKTGGGIGRIERAIKGKKE
ncbi:MAG: hypothetical protein ABIF01_04535 [Candidatus Micrarchaeota archaeon]